MKTIKITLITLFAITAFACDNQQIIKADVNFKAAGKSASKKSIIEKSDSTGQRGVNSFEHIVTEILTTSPRFMHLTKGLYKEVVENGGLSYRISLEGSPNPRQDSAWSYSRTYDFRLYEMYADKQLNTAHFSFNPHNRQLYEYDEVHNKIKQIEFDRNLLLKYDALCKR